MRTHAVACNELLAIGLHTPVEQAVPHRIDSGKLLKRLCERDWNASVLGFVKTAHPVNACAHPHPGKKCSRFPLLQVDGAPDHD